jgi:hypothetical protein
MGKLFSWISNNFQIFSMNKKTIVVLILFFAAKGGRGSALIAKLWFKNTNKQKS